jgi:hypothetical protein
MCGEGGSSVDVPIETDDEDDEVEDTNEENEAEMEEVEEGDEAEIAWNAVSFCFFGTQDAACSVINVIFEDFELGRSNNAFKNGVLSFKILCHTSLWKMTGGLRPFNILKELDELFNGQRILGVGKLEYLNTRLLWANNDYVGYSQNFKIVNFN